ncbi:MAG: methionyl-tRNA formyltransferase [Candidatus Omnitrophica bacterium CG_4_8_14_3_um_filter_43_15]|nr:MAG: methionyl-tRNA formyltransferase [Candidatus Omnitrophica bacterium CG1_02_43_210]PIV11762.1 MAG: methionyl-tRNA formyltransferase [Candidatus Omnitrophica bacterium CG03_land_8_20_14_0_80_43_22]PIW80955.1 MAG: methionyl-tRNA formyltransferase [Candidatus Omnitrophica bacterium CG_4_8_14_3_um_filter_43_15]PIY83354.1 MAG: methionyl-tRNA formyltransferase [Candidatus Omnitrophica bacterium CG_4_10_14_0_8_um_filter_43_18]PJC46056.1 MAG: methionyl-tRNA formyltransferase [Candidatus Omnitrop
MNIVFFGTSQFAVPSLEALHKSKHKVLAVVTQPDRKKGRLLQLSAPAVKEAAVRLNLNVLQPVDLGSPEFIENLKSFKADLFVVVSYGNILKKQVLDIPKLFCINLHGSVLPKYRGAAPINWAIINGDETSGVTVMKMNEKMDEGDIILKNKVTIMAYDTAESLSGRLAASGAVLLIKVIEKIEKNTVKFEKQDNSKATYAPKLKKEDGLIDWNKDAVRVDSHIRGMQPWPGAYTYLNNRLIKVCKASIYTKTLSGIPGEVVGIEKDGLLIATRSGAIVIEELQPESSRRMDVDAFAAGYRVKTGNILGSR